jgi:hypothetical protein
VLGDWGRKYNPSENPEQMTTFFDVENGTEIKPIFIDDVTGAKIGSRAMRAGD